jgi:hypothetical protein
LREGKVSLGLGARQQFALRRPIAPGRIAIVCIDLGASPVTEPELFEFIRLRPPIQCVLWEHPDRVKAKFAEGFDEIESYEDGSHLTRSLYKCRECGQLYFYEWYEWVDWKQGNDKMYTTLIPVQQEDVEALKDTDSFNLMRYFPRLHLDGRPTWVGKD